MKIAVIILLVIIILIGVFFVLNMNVLFNNFSPFKIHINNENEAKIIGEMIFRERYPDIDYSQYKIDVIFDETEKIWKVGVGKLDINGFRVPGGGGPELHITSSGEIKYLWLQA